MAEETLRGRFAGVDLDDLVDQRLVRTWLYWGMFWLMLTPTVGVTISAMFNYPDYLGPTLQLTFGRLRPVHVNGVIFGALRSEEHTSELQSLMSNSYAVFVLK